MTTRLATKGLLIAGYGGLLALMTVAGVDGLLEWDRIRARDAETRAQFIARSRALDRLRTGIFLSGTFARDAFLAPDTESSGALVEKISVLEKEAEAALRGLDESPQLRTLRGEIHVYFRVLDLMIETGRKRQASGVRTFFYNDLGKRRDAMLHLASEIAAIGEAESAAAGAKLAETFGRFRTRLIATLALVFLGGLLLAILTTRRLLSLERSANLRYREIQELSARLVKAQEDERRAISRELHDEVGQSLSALLCELGNLSPGSRDSRLEPIRALAERSVNAVRNMALLLRPSMLDDLGLAAALDWHARETSRRTGMQIRVNAAGYGEDLPDEHRTCIYRIAQEALHNCARHAAATHVVMTLRHDPNQLTLTVEDDGAGFDAQRVGGLGLVGMKERVARLGGAFEVSSRPGSGTVVTARLPLHVETAA